MKNWNFKKTNLKDAFIIHPFYSSDKRGGFLKDYSLGTMKSEGINHILKEVFYTYSKKGVIRALHFQKIKQQAKLVRCIKGEIFDIIVDLRKDSPTYLKWEGFYLNENNLLEIYIPEGFAHGYLVIEDSIVSYKCSEKFYANYDDGIKFDDPDLNLEWQFHKIGGSDKIIISDKDKNLQSLKEFISRYNEFIV